MVIATLSYSKLFEINLLQQEESAVKSNVSSKMLFIFARAEGIYVPLRSDTEITCTAVHNKI